jgi:TetR/AcrR family transcriptional repressor of mexCD-oprJ operon
VAEPADLVDEQRRADFVRNFDRIIDGATAALADNPSASMTEIAERSGVVRATLYRHFPAREDLFRAIYRSALANIDAAIKAAEPERGTAIEALEREIEALVGVIGRYRTLVEQRLDFPDLRPEADATFTPFYALVKRGQEQGSIRDDLPAPWLATVVIMLCVSAVRSTDLGELKSTEAATAAKRTILAALAG